LRRARSSYEACLLGLRRVELDPNPDECVAQLRTESSVQSGQKSPRRPGEAEIDHADAEAGPPELDRARRKAYFDRVQEIAAEQQPSSTW